MTKKTIFSIRKLSVGVASLAIAGVLTGVVPAINTTAPTASAQPMSQPWNGQIYGKVTVERVDRIDADNTVPQVVNTPIAAGETFYLRVKFESTDPAGFLSGVSWVTDFDKTAYEWVRMTAYSKSGIPQIFSYSPDGTRYAPQGMVTQISAEYEPETYVYVQFKALKPVTESDTYNTFNFLTDWNYDDLIAMYGMGAIPWTIDPLTDPDFASWERAWEGINYDDHTFGTKLVQDNTPAAKYSVAYKFASLDSSLTLPAEVTALLPTDAGQYEKGASVTLKRPTSESVAVADGTWEFVGYPSDKVTVGEANVEVTGTWRFVPKPKGSIIVKFVDAAGTTLKTETPVSNVVEGTAYDVNASATPTIEVNGKTYNFKGLQAGSPAAAGNVAAGNTTVVFEYEEDTTVPPVAKGSVVVKFVDENGIELKTETPAAFANVDENTPYDVSDLAEAEITVNGKTYTFEAVTSGSLAGNVAAGNNDIVLSYKEKVVTPPTSTTTSSSSSTTTTAPTSTTTSSSSSTTTTAPTSTTTAPTSSTTEPSSSTDAPAPSDSASSSTGQLVLKPVDGGKQLPKTGESTSTNAVVAGLGLLVAGLGFGLARKKKED